MRSDLVYLYDGSFEGLLCCVFESYEKKELPQDVLFEEEGQMSLYPGKVIETNFEKAKRVEAGIKKKASYDAYNLVQLGYYTCHPKKERLILDFIRLCMKHGRSVLSMLTDDTVNALQGAVTALTRESHQLKGFVRFALYNGVMSAVIEPKNFVLPLLAPHFCDRYSNETFMIYDEAHGAALVYQHHRSTIMPVENFTQPCMDEEEMQYRSLWKLFYDTIAITERTNPKCRMSHMQKRYWKHLTEMKENNSVKRVDGRKREELGQTEYHQLDN